MHKYRSYSLRLHRNHNPHQEMQSENEYMDIFMDYRQMCICTFHEEAKWRLASAPRGIRVLLCYFHMEASRCK